MCASLCALCLSTIGLLCLSAPSAFENTGVHDWTSHNEKKTILKRFMHVYMIGQDHAVSYMDQAVSYMAMQKTVSRMSFAHNNLIKLEFFSYQNSIRRI